jgi:hypothetical protein
MKQLLMTLYWLLVTAWWAVPVSSQAADPHAHHARVSPPAPPGFVEAARAATERYRERAVAIGDGFRMLGPDFPGMGEHWIHPGRMLEGTLDVTRPQGLSYAIVDGRPALLGVIYARPLAPGEAAPDFPVPGQHWHDHVGAIDEESILLNHAPSAGATTPGLRLAMLHVWVWLENPDGVFASDNWAVPFFRLGIEVPSEIPPDAARALSLLAGGDRYYLMLFEALSSPSRTDLTAAGELIARVRGEIGVWFSEKRPMGGLNEHDIRWLEQRWTGLWAEIARSIEPSSRTRLDPLLRG